MRRLTLQVKNELYYTTPSDAKGMPQLQIDLVDVDTTEIIHSFYMTPFRYYRFQISKDNKGNHCYGQSEHANLLEIYKKNNMEQAISLLTTLAGQAINNFMDTTMNVNSYFMKEHDICGPFALVFTGESLFELNIYKEVNLRTDLLTNFINAVMTHLSDTVRRNLLCN